MSLLRGLVADVQLDIWLLGYMFPVESRFVDTNFCYVGALLSCAGMIRGGITTFVDTYYFEEQVARAADESGMRGEYPSAILLGRALHRPGRPYTALLPRVLPARHDRRDREAAAALADHVPQRGFRR